MVLCGFEATTSVNPVGYLVCTLSVLFTAVRPLRSDAPPQNLALPCTQTLRMTETIENQSSVAMTARTDLEAQVKTLQQEKANLLNQLKAMQQQV